MMQTRLSLEYMKHFGAKVLAQGVFRTRSFTLTFHERMGVCKEEADQGVEALQLNEDALLIRNALLATVGWRRYVIAA